MADEDETEGLSENAAGMIDRLDRTKVVELLESASIQCYDHESDEELRQALRVNVADGTIPEESLDE